MGLRHKDTSRKSIVGVHQTGVTSDFVPIVRESRAVSRTAAIEIEIGGAVLRADAGVDLAFLGRIVRLLKAT
jgi:hypothetical protein